MTEEPSYIDYEVFLDPSFSPASFANSLVIATNNATDSPLDLSTPLSRVLFDLQEIDTHIHTLTSKSALPLLTHTHEQSTAAANILKQTEEQVAAVTQGYERLEREVLRKWETADEARIVAEKSLATVRLARAVGRCLNLGRQLESQLAEMNGRPAAAGAGAGGATGTGIESTGTGTGAGAGAGKEDFRALERAAYTLLNLRRMFLATGEGEEGHGLDRVKVVRTLRGDLVNPAESLVKSRAQQAINRFSMSGTGGTGTGSGSGSGGGSSGPGYKQARDMRTRLTTAATTLYLLSPLPRNDLNQTAGEKGQTPVQMVSEYRPELLLVSLQGYMQSAIGNSLAAVSRALTTLDRTLDRTLADLSSRCQDIVALEYILGSTRAPVHPLFPPQEISRAEEEEEEDKPQPNRSLLQPLLNTLDTPSLASYFWRTLASSLAGRVHEILQRGGVSGRTLRSNRDRLRRDIKECVLRGSQLPIGMGASTSTSGSAGGSAGGRAGAGVVVGNWEREAAVMVSAVVGAL